ncbi:MAG: DUF3301 domain-containing protein [Gammaproteobacteria bacterium]|nr:DUF3301 domain-containing protein [Gammaproteobacteria bacterium]
MREILLILALAFLLWLWRDSLKARERAIMVSRRACDQIQAQLLDDTVGLLKLRLCRTKKGTMALCRLYGFDFSLDGQQRRSGSVSMRGQGIEDLILDIDQSSTLQ